MQDWTACEIAARVGAGDCSAREVAESTLARIDARNGAINAIVARCDDEALAAADAVDAARARGEPLGPLAGVPVTVKVNVDQAGHATTNGLRLNAGLVAQSDSPVVTNLRKAGAVIVGRTNTPAFSLRWFTRNALHGATLNPRAAGLTPGGSSGGAGAAVASGMGAIGHGTDIAGSIRYPAYACGVHGLRPSLGRVPAYNATGPDRLIGGQLMAVSGPLARSIPDLRLALHAMSAPDPRDPWFIGAPLENPMKSRRVALCLAPDGMEVAPSVKAALTAAATRLSNAGYSVEDVPTPPWAEAMSVQLSLWMADTRHASAQPLQQESDPDSLFVYDCLTRIVPVMDFDALMRALQSRARLTRLWRGFLEEYPLVLCPVSGEPPFPDHLDVASEADFTRVLNAQIPQIALPLMGLPGLAVTTDLTGATPMGVQLLAGWHREDLLLEAGEILGCTVPLA